jgi:hypothetical protein
LTGAQGPAGADGAAEAILDRTPGVVTIPNINLNTTVATITLTAGKYLVMGKLDVRRTGGGSVAVTCDLLDTLTVIDTFSTYVSSSNYIAPSFISSVQPIAATIVTLACRTGSSNVTVQNRSLSAVKVQTLTLQ